MRALSATGRDEHTAHAEESHATTATTLRSHLSNGRAKEKPRRGHDERPRTYGCSRFTRAVQFKGDEIIRVVARFFFCFTSPRTRFAITPRDRYSKANARYLPYGANPEHDRRALPPVPEQNSVVVVCRVYIATLCVTSARVYIKHEPIRSRSSQRTRKDG